MKKYKYDTSSLRKALSLFGLSFLLVLCSGCSTATYTGKFGESSFSFQYEKKNYIYPYSRFLYNSEAYLPPKLNGGFDAPALISIRSIANSYIPSQGTHADTFISSMQNQKGIIYFEVTEKGIIDLDGISADFLWYAYESYDLVRVVYEGIFISFTNQGAITDIDIISPSKSTVENVYTLLKNTFTFN